MRKTHEAVIRRLTRSLLWSLSVLLIVVGILLLFRFTPEFSLDKLWPLVGTILVEIGVVTLLLELLSLESLVSIKIPYFIFNHGYLDIANDDELNKLVDDTIRARLRIPDLPPGDLERGRDWLFHTLGTPLRNEYKASIQFLDTPIQEQFIKGHVDTNLSHGDEQACLWVNIRYEYTTERNLRSTSVPINGDGVIHRVRDAIPNHTCFWQRYTSGGLPTKCNLTPSEVLAWIEHTIRPNVELFHPVTLRPIASNYSIRDLVLHMDPDGTLWMRYSVWCDYCLQPDEQVRVVFNQRWCINPTDAHYWVAFARTRNFQFAAHNFDGFNLLPIAVPTRWSQEGNLTVRDNLIIYNGMVYPGSTFAFVWAKSQASLRQRAA